MLWNSIAINTILFFGGVYGVASRKDSEVRVTGSLCAYDRLKVQWTLPEGVDLETASVGLYDAGSALDAEPLHQWPGPKALGVQWTPQQEAARWRQRHAPQPPSLHCDIGGPSCSVSVTNVGWDPDRRRLEVHFDGPTNTPTFLSSSGDRATSPSRSSSSEGEKSAIPLSAALSIHPMPTRLLTAPFWETSSKLVVLVDFPTDQRAIADAFADGTAFARVVLDPAPTDSNALPPDGKTFYDSQEGIARAPGTSEGILEGGERALRGQFSVRLGEVGRPLVLRLWAGSGVQTLHDTISSEAQVKVSGAVENIDSNAAAEDTASSSGSASSRPLASPAAESTLFAVSLCADETSETEAAPVVLHSLGPVTPPSTTSRTQKKSNNPNDHHDSTKSGTSTSGGALNPKPFWDPKGVFALTGLRPLVLPSASLPSTGTGSWSFSCWLWIADPPKGAFRTLLFKGSGQGGDLARTPSAWLHPDSMKVAMRASMGEANPDLGADSIGALPLQEWVHVAFTFENRTAAATEGHPFTYGFHVNGRNDVYISYPSVVSANDGDFRVGRDPERPGPRMLMAHPKLWHSALSEAQVALEHAASSNVLQPPLRTAAAATTSSSTTTTTAGAAEGTSLAAAAALTLGGSVNPLLPLTALSGSSLSSHLASKHFTGSQSLVQRSGIALGSKSGGYAAAANGGGGRGHRRLSAESSVSSKESEVEGDYQLEVYEGKDNENDEKELNGEEEEVFEESEASRVAREGAAHVHWQAGLTLLASCEAPDARLEAFEAAAALGHAQAFAAAGNLLLFGDERLPAGSAAAVEVAKATQCDHNPPKGRGGGDMTSDTSSSSSSSSGASSSATTDLVSRLGIMGGSYTDLSASGTARGLLYSQVAASLGDASSARQFAFLTLSGVGVGALADDRANLMAATADASTASLDFSFSSTLSRQKEEGREITHGSVSAEDSTTSTSSIVVDVEDETAAADSVSATEAASLDSSALAKMEIENQTEEHHNQAEMTRHAAMDRAVHVARNILVDVTQCGPELGAAAFDASLCFHKNRKIKAAFQNVAKTVTKKSGASAVGNRSPLQLASPPSTTSLGLGLLHAAAVMGDSEAQLALAHRYQHGLGVELSPEVAAFYFAASAERSHDLFHQTGRQPNNEMNRLRDGEEAVVGEGQRGSNDEMLALLEIQAEESKHPPSMAELAHYLYWGHHGYSRDQTRARRLWDETARIGDAADAAAALANRNNPEQQPPQQDPFSGQSTASRVAAAGMWLKGEGGEANHTRAVELYERAAASGSVPALNGLGFAYFNGHHLPQDLPKAFGYFQQASSYGTDGDSLFNAAYCLANGLGTPVDHGRAVQLYEQAAYQFGHFDAIYEMGTRHYLGRVPSKSRNIPETLKFLAPAAEGGEWGRRVREGFDAFLRGAPAASFLLFAEASEMGYEVAQSNAAYLLDQRHLPTAARDLGLLLPPTATTSSSSSSSFLEDSSSSFSTTSAADFSDTAPAISTFGSGLASSVFGPGLLSSRTRKNSGCSVSFLYQQDNADGADSDSSTRTASSLSSSSSTMSSSTASASNDLAVLSRLWSLHFHQRSAAQGNHESFVAVGDAYFYGCGVDGAPPASNQYTSSSDRNSDSSGSSRGSSGGNTKALVSTSTAPVAPNYEGALWWYSRAATAKVAKGAYSLGYMYERGLGAPVSEARAERHYEKAAELLGQDAEARIARGARGGGEGWWGAWYTSVVLNAAKASLRARRSLRAWGLEFLLLPGLF